MYHWLTSWYYTDYRGCQRFPTDITSNSLQFIKDNTGAWRHYYQTNYNHVHSGSNSFADVERLVLTEFRDHAAHSAVAVSKGIWNDFRDVLNGREPPDDYILRHE